MQQQQIGALMSRLGSNRVKNRSQGGRQLSYLEAYDVRATLIRIFGFGGFSVETLEYQVQHKELRQRPADNQGREQKPIWDVAVSATVRLTIHPEEPTEAFTLTSPPPSYIESAVSMQSNPDFGEAMDFAVKTAVSDALKRCATNLGTQFGLGLYDNGSTDEVVRTLIHPQQAALWEAAKEARAAAVSPEHAERLAHSVGRENGQQAPAQGAEQAADAGLDPDGATAGAER